MATGEILRVISSSPASVQPTFEAIARAAMSLCEADIGSLFRFDGQLIHVGAFHGTPAETEASRRAFPQRPSHRSVTARAILAATVVQIDDVSKDPEAADALRAFRTVLSVPMIRDGRPLGAITVARRVVRPFSDEQIDLLKTFADQAVIAIENVRLFKELEDRNRDLTATSEILQVISRSPTDVQPVFTAIARSAADLTGAMMASVYEFDGSLIHLRVVVPADWPHADDLRRHFPTPPRRDFAAGRVILDRAALHRADVQNDPDTPELTRALAGPMGLRGVLWVPMLRDGEAAGVIGVAKEESTLFSDEQVRLLQTFADQAVIAIENVRLFNETKEALERETATAEILKVIAGSPTDTQPVFDAVADSAVRLCEAEFSGLFRFDGERIHFVAHAGLTAPELAVVRDVFPVRASSSATGLSRAVRHRTVVHIADVRADPEWQALPASRSLNPLAGFRTFLAVPLVRDSVSLGAINVWRREVSPFSEQQISLLQTFADQAVIAIENVRLFTELQASNRELTTALDTQTATSDILGVISRSQTDVQPVFDAILASAVRLLGAHHGALTRVVDDQIELTASTFTEGAEDPALRAAAVEGSHTQAIRVRAPVNIADMQTDPRVSEGRRALARARGYRSLATVPLLRQDEALGAIAVARREPGGFADDEITLLQTFADQAVIAIENVRLFTELQARNRDLTATSEILQVISRSPTSAQPVFEAIAESAARLTDAVFGGTFLVADEVLHLAAIHIPAGGPNDAFVRSYPIPLDENTLGTRVAREGIVVNISDTDTEPSLPESQRERARMLGARSLLIVPMVRGAQAVGMIIAARRQAIAFTDKQVALLQTFADQAVIAIENVRLFTELEARTRELTRSVDELTALGEVSRALSSTLDLETVLNTIVARAVQLSAAAGALIYEYDESMEQFHLRSSQGLDDEMVQVIRAAPIRLGEGVTGKAAALRTPVQVADVMDERAYDVARIRTLFERRGYRSLLAVPLLFEEHITGALVVWRRESGSFATEIVNVLQTFATQSALAIQNARLFLEIEDKSRQLEAASQHKSEFLANMSHELRTPLNAIIGFSEVLAEGMFGEINDKQAEYLRDILESGRHLLSLINDILDLSKIEAGRMELEPVDFDLSVAIDNALTLVRERAGRRVITLRREIEDRVGMIWGDERKVKQVLLNLLSNAIKFTPDGGRIDVRAAVSDGMVEVSVADTGVGIAPEDQEKVFEEFRQVGTADKKVEGTGLGLALSRKFVELHGGRIRVKSRVGEGSTFTFTLPVRLNE